MKLNIPTKNASQFEFIPLDSVRLSHSRITVWVPV